MALDSLNPRTRCSEVKLRIRAMWNSGNQEQAEIGFLPEFLISTFGLRRSPARVLAAAARETRPAPRVARRQGRARTPARSARRFASRQSERARPRAPVSR